MVVVRSRTMVNWMPCGRIAFRNGSCARMRSTVSMMLAPGWRKMMTVTDGFAVDDSRRSRRSCVEFDHVGHVGETNRGPLW